MKDNYREKLQRLLLRGEFMTNEEMKLFAKLERMRKSVVAVRTVSVVRDYRPSNGEQ